MRQQITECVASRVSDESSVPMAIGGCAPRDPCDKLGSGGDTPVFFGFDLEICCVQAPMRAMAARTFGKANLPT